MNADDPFNEELYAQWEDEIARGVHDGGTCTSCGLPIVDHPLPDRFHQAKAEHCDAARQKASKR